ncbi:hypothetical protein LZD49_13620 [Dyadobacter sp. CY261]|uniref:hypothetical protein n=1 Tax=Dyadobacter sp. CY261 TaxID=2907203 RepID=UPI001F1B8F8C|nr:hypothetical protein [Dyadobacter sp. CY261]MCF0071511.1 hypothetical protein [Dyadobacter sp. CY261]
MKRFLVISGLVILFVMNSAGAFAQCAMCRGSVESSMGNGRNNVGVGLNTGIMFLFVMPYLLVAVIGYLWYRNSKRAQHERQFVATRVRQAYEG